MSLAEQLAEREKQLIKEVQEKQQALDDFRNGAAALLSKTHSVVGRNGTSGSLVELAYGANTRIVRQAIKEVKSPFSVRTLYWHLCDNGRETSLSKQSIATVLHRLRANNEIIVRRQGRGRRATMYQPISPTTKGGGTEQ